MFVFTYPDGNPLAEIHSGTLALYVFQHLLDRGVAFEFKEVQK